MIKTNQIDMKRNAEYPNRLWALLFKREIQFCYTIFLFSLVWSVISYLCNRDVHVRSKNRVQTSERGEGTEKRSETRSESGNNPCTLDTSAFEQNSIPLYSLLFYFSWKYFVLLFLPFLLLLVYQSLQKISHFSWPFIPFYYMCNAYFSKYDIFFYSSPSYYTF